MNKKPKYEYYDNGSIKAEIIYSKKDTAKFFAYYKTGELYQVSRMKNDKFHGQSICYYVDGNIAIKYFYKENNTTRVGKMQ